MIKALVDDLGRTIGIVDVPRGENGTIEYGHRDKKETLHVVGQARCVNFSDKLITLEQVQDLVLFDH